MAKQESCEARIGQELKDRLEQMDPECEACREYSCDEHINSESVLEFAVKRFVKVGLSWGGPADHFMVEIDDDGEIVEIYYHFQDWFDGARRRLTGDQFDQAEAWLLTNFYFGEL